MSMKPIGSIGWFDLTVEEATPVRDFYREVVGWGASEFDMGGYADYVMELPESKEGVAGVCHARGGNAGLPPVWLIYIIVADLEASLAKVVERGGKVRTPVRTAGTGRYAVIEDPAGACAALYQEVAGG